VHVSERIVPRFYQYIPLFIRSCIAGYEIEDDLLRKIREKESIALSISVLTYDQLLNVARHVLFLMRLSGIGGSENQKP